MHKYFKSHRSRGGLERKLDLLVLLLPIRELACLIDNKAVGCVSMPVIRTRRAARGGAAAPARQYGRRYRNGVHVVRELVAGIPERAVWWTGHNDALASPAGAPV